jgi:hypothetical protein
MKWIDRLERPLGHLAIPNLIRLVAIFNALVFVLYKLNPHFLQYLTLDPAAVMRGEVWRLVSYVLIPSFGGPIYDWLFAALYIYYIWWIGDGLEEAMGSFRVNLYYLIGVIGTTAAAFFSDSTNFATGMLNSSLFFAFARYYADQVIYLMMILPIKVKWMAWVSAAFIALGFIFYEWSYRLAVVAAFLNYFLFFGKDIVQEAVLRREVAGRRRRFAGSQLPEDQALHRCEVCGRTELAGPDLEFRVAKDGNEYCTEHLPKAAPAATP